MPYERQVDGSARGEAGRIRLIEQAVTGGPSAYASAALAEADVVLYDPALASVVAGLLPAGGYAEPLTAGAEGEGPEPARRARQLAADGWSVVQLIAPRGQRPEASATDEWPMPSVLPPGGRVAAAAKAFTANGLAG
jgi:hypothetical protein